MTLTVQELLIESMGLINTIAIDETPTSSELNAALRSANVMLDGWSAQKLMLRSGTDVSFSLTAGQASYTIGASGCNITTPNKIISILGGYVTDSNVDYPLEPQTESFYDSLEDKNISQSRPIYVAYDAGDAQQTSQKGTLYFYYIPDKAYTVKLETTTYLTEFVNLSDTARFEPAYYEAIIYNLALRLFRKFHDNKVPIPQDLVAIAHTSKNTIMSMNAQQYIVGFDFPGRASKYNIYTDGN